MAIPRHLRGSSCGGWAGGGGDSRGRGQHYAHTLLQVEVLRQGTSEWGFAVFDTAFHVNSTGLQGYVGFERRTRMGYIHEVNFGNDQKWKL